MPREKARASKKRYASRAEAKVAIAASENHGSPALHFFRYHYCGGRHLTRKP